MKRAEHVTHMGKMRNIKLLLFFFGKLEVKSYLEDRVIGGSLTLQIATDKLPLSNELVYC
jgi:hypothetical protein